MNKNQNIAMGVSLAVVAIMVGSAEIFGEKEIIFPEITAVAMGALIAPVQSWNTSRTRLFAAIVSAAIAGVCIVRFIPEILILRIAGAAGDVVMNKYAGLGVGVILMALLTYVISVFVIHQIQRESSVIGALYALGAKKKDLIRHYVTLHN